MKVTIERYSEQWPKDFEQVARNLNESLQSLPGIRIEHVGSTAVPGLAAKPVLDIDVIISNKQLYKAIERLEKDGYVNLGEQGIEGRYALEAPDESPKRHLYVCVDGSLALRNHIAVRDTLRHSKELRDEYSRLKHELSQQEFNDMDEYVFAKTALLQKVLSHANLTAEELNAIRDANS